MENHTSGRALLLSRPRRSRDWRPTVRASARVARVRSCYDNEHVKKQWLHVPSCVPHTLLIGSSAPYLNSYKKFYINRFLPLTLSSTSAQLPNGCEVPPALRLGSLPPQSSRFRSFSGQGRLCIHLVLNSISYYNCLGLTDAPPTVVCLITHRSVLCPPCGPSLLAAFGSASSYRVYSVVSTRCSRECLDGRKMCGL
jgi:hypothetical protein